MGYDDLEMVFLKNQMALMCFVLYGRDDARAKLELEAAIKSTRKMMERKREEQLK